MTKDETIESYVEVDVAGIDIDIGIRNEIDDKNRQRKDVNKGRRRTDDRRSSAEFVVLC